MPRARRGPRGPGRRPSLHGWHAPGRTACDARRTAAAPGPARPPCRALPCTAAVAHGAGARRCTLHATCAVPSPPHADPRRDANAAAHPMPAGHPPRAGRIGRQAPHGALHLRRRPARRCIAAGPACVRPRRRRGTCARHGRMGAAPGSPAGRPARTMRRRGRPSPVVRRPPSRRRSPSGPARRGGVQPQAHGALPCPHRCAVSPSP